MDATRQIAEPFHSRGRGRSRRRFRKRLSRVRWRRVLLVGLLAGGVGYGGYWAAREWRERQIAGLLADAQAHEEAGDWRQARANLERAVAARPSDPRTKEKLGRLLLASSGSRDDRRAGLDLLLQVHRLEPDRRDLLLEIGRGQLGVSTSDALATAERLLKADPADRDALVLKAEALERTGAGGSEPPAPAAAVVQAYRECIDRDRKNPQLAIKLAHLMRERAKELARAEGVDYRRILVRADWVVDEMVLYASGSAAAHLARFHYRRASLPAAATSSLELDEDVSEALRLAPADPAVQLAAAENLAGSEIFSPLASDDPPRHWRSTSAAQVEQFLRKGLEARPRDEQIHAAIAQVLLWDKRESAAQEAVEAGIAAAGPRPLLLARKASIQLAGGNAREADETIRLVEEAASASRLEASIDVDPLAVAARLLRARWLLLPGNPEAQPFRALTILAALSADKRMEAPEFKGRIALALARCEERIGQDDQALESYSRALEADPGSLAARVGRADAHRRLGNYAEAADQYAALLADPVWRTRGPPPAEWSWNRARCLLARQLRLPRDRREFREVEAAAGALPTLFPGSPLPILFAAEVRRAKGDAKAFEEAAAILESAKKDFAKDPRYWAIAVDAYSRWRAVGAARRALEEWSAVAPVPPDSRRKFAALSSPSGIREPLTAQAVAGRDSFLELQAGSSGLMLASAETDESQTSTQSTMDQLRRVPDAAEAAFHAEDVAELARLEKDARRVEGEGGSLALYVSIFRLLASGKSDDAASLEYAGAAADKLLVLRPNWSRAHFAAALVEEHRGNLRAAESKYRSALKSREPRLALVARLASVLALLDRWPDLERLFESLPDEERTDPLLLPFSVFSSLKANRTAEAVARAAEAASARPGDAVAWTLLALARTREKNFVAADQAVGRCIAEVPNDPRGWIAGVHAHVRGEHPIRVARLYELLGGANELLDSWETRDGRWEEARLIGLLLECEGDFRLAAESYRAAAAAGGRARAVSWSLVPHAYASFPASDRTSADVAPFGDGHPSIRWTVALLAPGKSSGEKREAEDAPPALRALRLLSGGEPTHRAQSIEILEAIPAAKRGAGEELLLARFAAVNGRPEKALSHYRASIARHASAESWAEMARVAMAFGKREDASQAAARLDSLHPKGLDRYRLRIGLHRFQQDSAAAVAFAREFIDGAGNNPHERRRRAESAAVWLADAGDPGAAESLLPGPTSMAPEDVALRIRWLAARSDRAAEAVEMLVARPLLMDPDERALVALRALQRGVLSSEHRARAEQVVEAAFRSLAAARPERASLASAWMAPAAREPGRLRLFEIALSARSLTAAIAEAVAALASDSLLSIERTTILMAELATAIGPTPMMRIERAIYLLDADREAAAIVSLESMLFDPSTPPAAFVYLSDAFLRAGRSQESLGTLRLRAIAGNVPLSAADRDVLRLVEKQEPSFGGR